MNVQETAIKWGISPSTIYSYLKDDLILGAEKINGQWAIPKDALAIFKPGKTQLSQSEMIIYVLRALNENKTIPSSLLNLSDQKLQSVFKALEKQNYVTQLDEIQHSDLFAQYLINIDATKPYLKPQLSLKSASALLLKYAPTLISLLQTLL